MADRWIRGHRPDGVPLGRRRAGRLADRRRRADAARDPRRAGVHAAGAARPRLREQPRRAGLAAPARCRAATFVFLFTDLANPTSNKIYQDIGYEPVNDIDEWDFSG